MFFAPKKLLPYLRPFLGFNALGLFWFFCVLSPWQAFIASDDAIPYIMTIEPWHLQDFYFWGAMRFGSVFVTFWKAVGRHLFGSSAEAFYLGHALVFFNGLAVWWLALPRTSLRLLFTACLLPYTMAKTSYFLFPGHLYGMLFALQGLFFWGLLFSEGKRRSSLLGVFTGMIYWQHELVGLGCLFWAFAAKRVSNPRRFWMAFVPILIFCECARQWAKRWPVNQHFSLNLPAEFLSNIGDFLPRGFPLGTPALGVSLLVATVVLCGYGALRVYRRNADLPDRIAATFLVCLVFWISVVLDSRWYSLNGRSERYFVFLVPFSLAILMLMASSGSLVRYRKISTAFFVLLAAGVFMGPLANVWYPSSHLARQQIWETDRKKLASLAERNCDSVVGSYWNTYKWMALSDGKIVASADDIVRNPELLERAQSLPHVCSE